MDPEAKKTLEHDARLVIERYFLGSVGGSIREIRVFEETVFVSAGLSFEETLREGAGSSEWSVRPMTRALNFERSEGYALYAVAPFMSRHAREVGVALLPNGWAPSPPPRGAERAAGCRCGRARSSGSGRAQRPRIR